MFLINRNIISKINRSKVTDNAALKFTISKFSLAQQPEALVNTRGQVVALTPLFGNGAGAHGIGKISSILIEIGKFDIILMYDVSIARLIPIL